MKLGGERETDAHWNPADEPASSDEVPIWADLDEDDSASTTRTTVCRSVRADDEFRMMIGRSYGKIGRWALAELSADEAVAPNG